MITKHHSDYASSKVLVFGTFDVDNYGDLLFPVIANWRLMGGVVACSPTNTIPSFDRVPEIDYIAYHEIVSIEPAAMLVGGGNILHFRPSSVYPFRSKNLSYAGLQFIPLILKQKYGAPVIYNSPSMTLGRSGPFDSFLFRLVYASADYLSFRDRASIVEAERLSTHKINFVPDTVYDISRAWPVDRNVRPSENDYLVVHVNVRYGGQVQNVARVLDDLQAKLCMDLVLLPIGPCHGDLEYARQVAERMTKKPILIDRFNVYIFAQYIANAQMYIGSSMHGFITAASYSVKAALVLDKEPMNKFKGALEVAGMSQHSCFSSWIDVIRGVNQIKRINAESLHLIFKSLDEHWDGINKLIHKERTRGFISPFVYAWKPIVLLNQFLGSFSRVLSRLQSAIIRSLEVY